MKWGTSSAIAFIFRPLCIYVSEMKMGRFDIVRSLGYHVVSERLLGVRVLVLLGEDVVPAGLQPAGRVVFTFVMPANF